MRLLAAALALGCASASLTDEAIELAQQGNLADALELFEEARDADPFDAKRWQNVGVTEMRLGRLDDARVSLEEAARLAPRDETCEANLDALSQHEAHRAEPGGRRTSR